MSQKCKNNADELKQEKEKVETDEERKLPETFKDIAKDVRREVQGKLKTVMNAELKSYIGKILEVLGVNKISNAKIEEVMFLSESRSDVEKKTSGSESDASVHNGLEKAKGEEEKEETEETGDKFDPEKDIMLFIDENEIAMFEDMKDLNQLQIFNKVNRMKNFPGYQPKELSESLVDIVMKSVGLMQLLNGNKKLVKSEVEDSEDLIREVKSDMIREKWLKGRGGDGGGAKVEKENPVEMESDVQNGDEENASHMVNSSSEEKPVKSDV